MTVQSRRSIVRLPQLTFQYLGNRRTALSPSRVERVPALYNVFNSQHFSKVVLQYNLKTPALGRSYAQRAVSRPKAHTGRTTAAPKKAPATSRTKAAKKPATKTTKAKAKAKPVSRTKSKVKPRIKAKPKPAKKRKAKAKPKPKAKKPKKPKKVLTEAQKIALTKRKLIVKALQPPRPVPASAWTVFLTEKIRGHDSLVGSSAVVGVTKEAAPEYRQLTPEQREHYNHIANQNKARNNTTYRQWIESHSPSVIYEANLARRHLKRLGMTRPAAKIDPLHDDRQVKGRRQPFTLFYQQRALSGDFKGLVASEGARLAGREWKALSASEKKHFEDLAAQDMLRYEQERKTVLNKTVTRQKVKA